MAKIPGKAKLKDGKQELFCWLYAGYHNRDLFGNGTQCYLQVYNADELAKLQEEIDELLDSREKGYSVEVKRLENRVRQIEKSARTLAARLLAKVGIRERVDYLIDSYINDSHTDRELQFVIMQRYNLDAKVAAIKEVKRAAERAKGDSGLGGTTVIFGWEDDPEDKKGAKKRITVKKVAVKSGDNVDWDE